MSDKDNWLALRKYLDTVMKKNPHEEETRMLRISDFVDEQLQNLSGPTKRAAELAGVCEHGVSRKIGDCPKCNPPHKTPIR